MKLIIILLIGMVSQLAAAPYVEYKNEVVFKYDNYVKNLNHFRVGYQFILPKGMVFIEAGMMEVSAEPRMLYGESGEIGYKFDKGNWTFKGKWEYKNLLENKSKLQTEVRYTFK